MKEATKARQLFGELEKRIFVKMELTSGCGDDPITPDAKRFDTDDGDANHISRYISDTFHYVFCPLRLNMRQLPLCGVAKMSGSL